jgi:ATPase subunit of ABC transporter with duplicated ATPase domains
MKTKTASRPPSCGRQPLRAGRPAHRHSGANGQGKSTLVKTIAREMKALAGTVTEGKGLNIGYFAQQELDVLRPREPAGAHGRLARELGAAAPAASREQDLRNFLGTFNFSGDMVKQAVGSMSGGEKARLVLAMIVWQRPNLLLLDEPTNHLDLATREALAMALNDFDGTVMLVSHDRHLLRAVCEDFWMVGRGVVGPSMATWTTTSAICWKSPSACVKKHAMPNSRPLARQRCKLRKKSSQIRLKPLCQKRQMLLK